MDAEELLRRYAAGERDFANFDLSGILLGRRYADELIKQYQTEENTRLGGVNLRGINLSGANLEGANLEAVDFMGANLSGANLTGAILEVARLNEANLSIANTIFPKICYDDFRV